MAKPLTYLALLIGLVAGFLWGQQWATWDVLYRDHVQASAGIFIDGYAKNKLYRVVPFESASTP